MTKGNKLGFLLAGNGAFLNRGCEGIFRGTVKVVRHFFPTSWFVSAAFGPEHRPIELDLDVVHRFIPIHRFSRTWFVQNALRMLGVEKTWFPILGDYIDKVDTVLALGGDNYSMDYGSLRVHLALVDYVLSRGKPLVIWGASVGPFGKRGPRYEACVLEKLKRVSAILVREDVSADYLVRRGLKDNVRRVADPAFLVDSIPPQPEVTVPEGAIGFNFSPLMARYVSGGDLGGCVRLVSESVELLCKTFDRPVVLIAHVLGPGLSDYSLLEQAAAGLSKGGYPVQLLPATLSAREIKWIMARLTCFAGARTHSTIAAISEGVPTLSFAYSIKSWGINRDVFGHERYVLDPQQVTPEGILKQVGILLDEREAIREHLHHRLPRIRDLALRAGAYLKEIVEVGHLT
jgi:colanic acid/amylovoran biosynthesis protein